MTFPTNHCSKEFFIIFVYQIANQIRSMISKYKYTEGRSQALIPSIEREITEFG
jgi:hypothetical protein